MYFNGPFEDLAVLAAPWYRLCANLHTRLPPVLLPEERVIYIETTFFRDASALSLPWKVDL